MTDKERISAVTYRVDHLVRSSSHRRLVRRELPNTPRRIDQAEAIYASQASLSFAPTYPVLPNVCYS